MLLCSRHSEVVNLQDKHDVKERLAYVKTWKPFGNEIEVASHKTTVAIICPAMSSIGVTIKVLFLLNNMVFELPCPRCWPEKAWKPNPEGRSFVDALVEGGFGVGACHMPPNLHTRDINHFDSLRSCWGAC